MFVPYHADFCLVYLIFEMEMHLAIRFVLSDLFQNLRSEDRHALLHVCILCSFLLFVFFFLEPGDDLFFLQKMNRRGRATKWCLLLLR